MSVSSRHILSQGPVLGALTRTAYLALRQGLSGRAGGSLAVTPGAELVRKVSPPPRDLVDAYLRHVGGDPRAYRGELPPHLFPQWCMPLLSRTLEGLPYPMLRVVNAGCRVEIAAPLPDAEPLEVRARLEDIDDDGRRAVLHQRLRTGPVSSPDTLRVDFYAIVPARVPGAAVPKQNGGREKREHARVPEAARELARFFLARDAGLSFAKLTGDFNPIHWVPLSARAAGFPGLVLHGFSTIAHAWEALLKNHFGGDPHAVRVFDAKLTRPLALPREVGVYLSGHELFVGDAAGGPAYMTAVFDPR